MPSHNLPRQPSRWAKPKLRLALAIIRWPLIALLRYRGTKLTWSGTEHLHSTQPALVIANHVNQLDPAMLFLASGRPIHFLATQSILQEPRLAWICKFFGVVFKKKFATDLSAIRSLQAWCKVGSIVGLFPEGERSWDGRLIPLVPGTERLVTMLNVPLITARVINGDRVWPRWAPQARRGRVHIEFDPPVYFDKKTPIEKIRQHIVKHITVSPSTSSTWTVRGNDLASGLANPLFACPRCYKFNRLSERGDEIHCQHCDASWRVDDQNVLIGYDSTPSMEISSAFDHVRNHLANNGWCIDLELFNRDQTVIISEPMELWDYSKEPFSLIDQGLLNMSTSTLSLQDSEGTILWSIPLSTIRVVSVELQRRLQFRTHDKLYEARIPRQSVVLWELVAQHWINSNIQQSSSSQRQLLQCEQ